jgi:hypothetical protein
MYIVKRYSVSKARERLADVLDEVDRSGSVLIERGEAQYVISPKRRAKRQTATSSSIETVDAAVSDGQWRWDWAASGIRFAGRRRSRP